MEQLYTLEEATKILHITKQNIYSLVKAGVIPAVKIGRKWRIRESVLEKIVKEGTK